MIEGQRCSGKTTLTLEMSKFFFLKGYTVSMIPEWSFNNNGPSNPEEWIKAVFEERLRLQRIAFESNADIVVIDRGFMGLEAFVLAEHPEYEELLMRLMPKELFFPEVFVYLTANREELKRRALRRKGNNCLNRETIDCYYMDLFSKYKIEPLRFNTSDVDKEEILQSIWLKVKNFL